MTALLLAAASNAGATPLTPDSILVTTRDFGVSTLWAVREYDAAGTLLQRFAVPYPSATPPASARPRGVTVAGNGQIAVYNGTFDPYVSTLDPVSGDWQHRTLAELSTANVGGYGAVASFGDEIFASDMNTQNDPASGVVAFDLVTGAASRFGAQQSRDLTLGHDGLLYAVRPAGTGESIIDVYDPRAHALLRSVPLAVTVRTEQLGGIAVAADGTIYTAAPADGTIVAYAPTGEWLATSPFLGGGLQDLALGARGRLIVGTRFGQVFVTDRDFSSVSSFVAGPEGVYVTIVPEPETALLVALGLAALRRRRVRG